MLLLGYYFVSIQRQPRSTLFPYTTLFRSNVDRKFARFRIEEFEGSISCVMFADAYGPAQADLVPEAIGTRSDRKSTRLNSSHSSISYAVFCLKKKKDKNKHTSITTEVCFT